MRILALAAMLAAFTPAPPARADESVSIENDRLRVEVSLRSGGIARVLRKESGFLHEHPASPAEVLELRIPLGDWDGHSLSGAEARRVRVLSRSSDSLALRFDKFTGGKGKFALRATLNYRLDGDNLVTHLKIINDSGHAIDRVAFPMLGAEPAPDGSEALYTASGPLPLGLLFSRNTIRAGHDPFQRLDPTDFRGWGHSDPAISSKGLAYPSADSLLHTAWMSYQAGEESIGWDVRDQTFQYQFAVVQRELERDAQSQEHNRQTYTLAWHWFPAIAPGKSWESPEVWLRFAGEDWHGTARQHRQWLDSWIRKPDPPEAFRASLGWISQGITSYDQIPGLAQRGVEVGAPYFVVYGWYGYGMTHLSYDFLPRAMLGGEEGLRRNLAAARALGAYPLAWYNGSTTVESTPGHLRHGRDWALIDRHGGFMIDGRWSLFDPDRPPTTDDNVVHLNVDMGTAARDFVIESVRRMIADYGFSGIEMDQGGKNYLAYATSRGADPELRYTQGAREIYEAAMKIVRAHDPNGIVVGEGVTDFMNQYVDSSWLFEGGGGFGAGAVDWVQTSSYLRYSLPWVTFPSRAVPEDPGQANRAFMLNAPLDIFVDLELYPDYAGHLKQLHALKRSTHPFLYGGEFSDTEGFALRNHDPARVLAKSYLAASQDAVVVINTTPEPQSAELEFAATDSAASITVYRLGGAALGPEAGRTTEVELGPYGVAVVVLDRADVR